MHTPYRGFIGVLFVILVGALLVSGGTGYLKKDKIQSFLVSIYNQSVLNFGTQATSTTQTSNVQTGDWKTYRNEKYGFEFRYAPHLFLKKGEKLVCVDEKSSDTDAPSTCFWNPQAADASLEDMGKRLFPDLVKAEHSRINGEVALAFQSGPNEFPANEIIFIRNKKLYRISANSSYSEEILSTLKFTDSIDNSTWKTYRNEKYGFELEYPASLVSIELIGPTHKQITFAAPPATSERHVAFVMGIDEPQPSQTLRQWILSSTGLSDREVEDITVNGRHYLKWYEPGLGDGVWSYATSVSSNLVVTLSATNPSASGEEFKKLLSTFKSISPVDTSTWKTYRNEKYGFEVQYPPDYTPWKYMHCAGGGLDNVNGQDVVFWKNTHFNNDPSYGDDIRQNKIMDFDLFINDPGDTCVSPHYSGPGDGGGGFELVSTENVVINNYPVLKRNYMDTIYPEGARPFNFSTYRFERNGNYITLLYNNGITSDPEVYKGLFQEFLMTFKFTE